MKKILILILGMFTLGIDAYVVAGLIPEMAVTFRKTNSEIGQGVTLFTLCFAISAPLFASMAGKVEVKKILFWAMLIFTVSNSITMLAGNYWIYLLSRSMAGIGAGIFSPVAASSSSYLIGRKHQGKALAFIIGGMNSGAVIGVPIGLLICKLSNWHITMLLIVILGILSMIGILFLPRFTITAPPTFKERFSLFLDKHVLRVLIVTLCVSIGSLGLYTYLSVVVGTLNPHQSLAPMLSVWGIGGLIGSFGVGFLIDRYKNAQFIVLVVLVSISLCFLFIPVTIHYVLICYLPFILWGMFGWASQAPQQHILLENYASHGSTAVALNSSINYLGSALGSALGGLILFNFSNIYILIYCSITIIMIGALFQIINIKIDRKNS
ncbi:MFS transporter [Staphylococcus simulans]